MYSVYLLEEANIVCVLRTNDFVSMQLIKFIIYFSNLMQNKNKADSGWLAVRSIRETGAGARNRARL